MDNATSPPSPPLRKRTIHKRADWWLLRYGCLIGLLGFVFVCVLLSGFVAGVTFKNGPAVFALAVFLASLTAVPYGLALLWMDRNEKEPPYLIATAFMWGAAVATAISLIVNTTVGIMAIQMVQNQAIASQLTASLSAPFIEEVTKGWAVLFIFLLFRREFDNVLDGILYGAMVGLGFAWYENILYYVQAGEGGTVQMLKLSWLRGVVNGVSSHVCYTGLTGLGFGLVRVMRKGVLRWLFVPFFWGMAMFAHFVWNTFTGVFIYATGARTELEIYLLSLPGAVLVLQSPFILLLLVVILIAWWHENRIIRLYLHDERPDILAPEDIDRLVPARRRMFLGLKRVFTGGPLWWWRWRSLEQDYINLAFAKWHLEADKLGWGPDEDADVIGLRRAIRRRRKELAR